MASKFIKTANEIGHTLGKPRTVWGIPKALLWDTPKLVLWDTPKLALSAIFDTGKAVAKSTKTIAWDVPKGTLKGIKVGMWDAPKATHSFVFSKKGAIIIGSTLAGIAAIRGIVSRARRSPIEHAQEQEAMALQASAEAFQRQRERADAVSDLNPYATGNNVVRLQSQQQSPLMPNTQIG